jgi:hypothetical protein
MKSFLLPIILYGLFVIILFGCQLENYVRDNEKDVFEYNWGTKNNVYIEQGSFHSYKKLDTVNNKLTGDTLTPLKYEMPGMVMISQLKSTEIVLQESENRMDFIIKKAAFVTDTFIYDIKKFIGKTFLILYSEKAVSQVYALKSGEITLRETDHIRQPVLEISGYKTGESIARDKIKVLYSDSFGESIIEEASLNSDENVIFTIVGKKYIQQIRKIHIPEDDIESLKKSIDNEFSVSSEFEEIENGDELIGERILAYYWDEKEVSVSLKKIINIYDGKIENEDPGWTMTYENLLITQILQEYLEPPQENI